MNFLSASKPWKTKRILRSRQRAALRNLLTISKSFGPRLQYHPSGSFGYRTHGGPFAGAAVALCGEC